MTLNGLNAAPASPVSDSVAENTAPHFADPQEVECNPATAPSSAAPPAPAEEPVDDVQASLHEQLAALVQALALENESEPKSPDGDSFDVSVLPNASEQGQPEASVSPERQDWQPEIEPLTSAVVREVMPRKLFGFVAGLVASLAVGSGMLVFIVSMNKPAAIAGNDNPKFEARFTDVAADSNPTVAIPLEERVPHAFGIEQQAAIGPQKARDVASEKQTVSVTDSGDRAASVKHIEPSSGANASPAEPASNKPIDAPATVQAATKHGVFDDQPKRQSMEVTSSFETVIQPAEPEKQSTPPVAAAPATEPKRAEETSVQTRVARVIKYVNMRAGPDNYEEVLAVIPEGSSVEVIQCNQWCEVIFAGQRGWIYKGLMTVAGADDVSFRYN